MLSKEQVMEINSRLDKVIKEGDSAFDRMAENIALRAEQETDSLLREAMEETSVCRVHGGTTWKGGYCDRWPSEPGGPCVIKR